MSENNQNNPGSDSSEFRGDWNNPDNMYELITSYLDNEIKDPKKLQEVKNLIDSDPNFHNRYTIEKLTKEKLQQSLPAYDTPQYVIQNIGNGIDGIIKSAGRNVPVQDNTGKNLKQDFSSDKTYYRKYFLYGGVVFLLLIISAFIFSSFFKNNPDDLVSVSRNVFEDVESGDVKVEYECKNARELEEYMNKKVDFKVYVPDLKDAVLIGGVCNEINGEKVAHFVYRKNNFIIYTIQGNKEHILNNIENLILNDEFKTGLREGKNWITCTKDKEKTAVLWYSGNVICSSVAHLEPQVLTATLKNTK